MQPYNIYCMCEAVIMFTAAAKLAKITFSSFHKSLLLALTILKV